MWLQSEQACTHPGLFVSHWWVAGLEHATRGLGAGLVQKACPRKEKICVRSVCSTSGTITVDTQIWEYMTYLVAILYVLTFCDMAETIRRLHSKLNMICEMYEICLISWIITYMDQMWMFLSWVAYFTVEMDIFHKNVQACVGIPGTSTVTGNINVLITPSRHNLHWFKVPEPCLPVEQFVHITFHCNYFCPLKSKYWPQLKTPCHHILHRQYIWKMSACC